jgi:hypothetical protein
MEKTIREEFEKFAEMMTNSSTSKIKYSVYAVNEDDSYVVMCKDFTGTPGKEVYCIYIVDVDNDGGYVFVMLRSYDKKELAMLAYQVLNNKSLDIQERLNDANRQIALYDDENKRLKAVIKGMLEERYCP